MKATFEIVKKDDVFVLVHRPSDIILFSADTEKRVRSHFLTLSNMKYKRGK